MKDCLPRGLACEQHLHARRQGATADPKDVWPCDPEGDGARRNPRRLRGRAAASVGRGDAADRASSAGLTAARDKKIAQDQSGERKITLGDFFVGQRFARCVESLQ